MNKGVTQLPSRATGSTDRIDRIIVKIGRLVLIVGVAMTIFAGASLLPRLFDFATPPLYDRNLLHLDEILTGGHPAFLVAHFAAVHPLVFSVMYVVYHTLSYALVAMFLLAVCFPRRIHPGRALFYIFGTACAGAAMYVVCPAASPKVSRPCPRHPQLPLDRHSACPVANNPLSGWHCLQCHAFVALRVGFPALSGNALVGPLDNGCHRHFRHVDRDIDNGRWRALRGGSDCGLTVHPDGLCSSESPIFAGVHRGGHDHPVAVIRPIFAGCRARIRDSGAGSVVVRSIFVRGHATSESGPDFEVEASAMPIGGGCPVELPA
jgi:hypothetical protein